MAYSGSSPSLSRESEKCKAFLPALGSFQVVWGFGPCLLEPAGRSRKSSAVDQPRGGEALLLLGPKRGQGRRRTFVWALLRARNYTWYLKVSFGVRLEARMMICLSTPFTVVTWRMTFPPGCLGVLPYHPRGPQHPLLPPETLSFFPLLGGHHESHLPCAVLLWMLWA